MFNRKKTIVRAVLAGAAALSVIATAGCANGVTSAGGDSVNLEFASFMPESHPYSVWYLSWADEVTEATAGRVTFTNYFSSSLIPAPELAAAVTDGRVDLSQPNTNYTPERFPLSEIVSVPYSTTQVGAAMEAVIDMYENYAPFQEEFSSNGVIPLQFQPTGTNVLGSNRAMAGTNDLQGARVRSASYFAQAMQDLRANPISMPLGDVYQSMQTGLLDAWMTPMENTISFNLAEVTTHIQDPGMGPTSLSVILMNEKTFDSLSTDDQKAILEISADYNSRFVELLNEIDQETCETIAATDIQLEAWNEEDVATTRESIQPKLLEGYFAAADAAGVDAREFVEKWDGYQADYSGEFGEYLGSVQTCQSAK